MILSRLKQYIDSKDITVYAFEKSIGMSNASFGKPLKSGGSIGTDKLENILKEYPDINPSWLLTGNGSMILEPEFANLSDFEQVYKRQPKSNVEIESQQIPLYDIECYAGLVPLFYNGKQKPVDYINIPRMPKCDGAIYVTGDSMYPLLKSGDIVLYKTIKDFLNDIFWGEMYLISVEVDGEEYISVKYIKKSENPKCITLVSYNRHHSDKDVYYDRIRAMALIKASIRINSMT